MKEILYRLFVVGLVAASLVMLFTNYKLDAIYTLLSALFLVVVDRE